MTSPSISPGHGESALLEIAVRAIMAHRCELEARRAQKQLEMAYAEWKEENGVEYAARHSPEWDRMLEGTRDSYLSCKAVKRAHLNAKRRLTAVIVKFTGEQK